MEFENATEVKTFKNVNFKKIGYDGWIANNYPDANAARLQCAEATTKMVEDFPELKRVRGLASVAEPMDLYPTRTPHWWCVTPEGSIVDPTAHQFPTRIIKYDEADEARGAPTGKCPNCGDLSYMGDYLCSEKCNKEYMDYLNSPEEY